jgi:Suppressor of fused protein (SUFU)
MAEHVEQEGVEPQLYRGGEGDSERHAAMRSHYESFFDTAGREVYWPVGPAVHAMPGFRVLEIPPNAETALWTYASVGAFASARGRDTPVEFLLMTEAQTGRGVELVTMVAHYHLHHPLGLGHTLAIGEAWLPGASCDAFLVSPPYPFGPSLERAPLGEGEAHVCWLLPVTPAERRFVKTHGVEALVAEFDLAQLRYWRPDRRSLVE